MHAMQQFEAKLPELFPDARIVEREDFLQGGVRLTLSQGERVAIVHWFPKYGDQFGLTDFSDPENDRHIFEFRPDKMFANESEMIIGLRKILSAE